MDSKIIGLIAGSFLLTGCMAAKVDKLHTTTVQLSNDVDSYVKMTDKVVELNNQGFLYYSSNPYFTTYLRSYENSLTPNQKKELDKISFNTQFLINYRNYSLGEDIKKQTSQVSIFFKILPQVLESKDLEPNFQSLVKNIDNLNQTLEKNLNAENGELVGKLKERDIDLINKIFAEGYKKYQLKKFEEILGNQYN
ncbi:hypothetical protein, partial [Acinetobacter seifertii]|uniref:hypothetical protein n=1 Tax=Acinetobacter seifertii TaxID=1530123 RepID=UPI0011123368